MNLKYICLIVTMLIFPNFTKAAYQPFSNKGFIQIKQKNHGKNWLMILWSVDCPACFKELALIQKLRIKNKDLPVVIINTDDNQEIAVERQKILIQYQLNDLPNMFFNEGQGDKERYYIDPTWFGELPRSYFINEQGEFYGKSGLLEEKHITQWLGIN